MEVLSNFDNYTDYFELKVQKKTNLENVLNHITRNRDSLYAEIDVGESNVRKKSIFDA